MRVLIISPAVCFQRTRWRRILRRPGRPKPARSDEAKSARRLQARRNGQGTKLWAGNCAAASELREPHPRTSPPRQRRPLSKSPRSRNNR